MRKIGNFIWTLFLCACLCLLTAAGIYAFQNGIHEPVPREITEATMVIDETTIPARTDFSGITEPVIDSNGKLTLPDNTTVSEVSVRTIRTDFCEFQIPKSWVNNVVVRVLKMDQKTDKELYDLPVENTEVIQFFEKNTFQKYQTQEYVYTEGASRKGKITELYIADVKNDLTQKTDNPLELHFANITDDTEYMAFMHEFMEKDSIVDEEFEKEYNALSGIDYQGCIISSIHSDKGALSVANSYIQTRYVNNYNADAQGMEQMDTSIEKNKTSQDIPEHKSAPDNIGDALKNEIVYEWKPYSIPYAYQDRGSSYPYAPMESGGLPVQTQVEEPSVDIDLAGDSQPVYQAPSNSISFEDDTNYEVMQIEEAPAQTEDVSTENTSEENEETYDDEVIDNTEDEIIFFDDEEDYNEDTSEDYEDEYMTETDNTDAAETYDETYEEETYDEETYEEDYDEAADETYEEDYDEDVIITEG